MWFDSANKRRLLHAVDLLLLLALAAGARCYELHNESVWLDDYFSAAYLDESGLFTFLSSQRHENWEMVPVYYSLQYYWTRPDPGNITWVRMLSVICGLGAVALAYFAGCRAFGAYAGRIAGLCIALSPYQIFHSQGIRPYALIVPLALLSCWMLYTWATDGSRKACLLHYVCNFLLVWTHLLTPVLFIAQGIALLSLRMRLKKLLLWSGLQLFLILQAFLWTTTIDTAPDPEVPRPSLGSPLAMITSNHADYGGDFFGKVLMNEGEYLRWVIGFPPKYFDTPLPEIARDLVVVRQPLELALARLIILAAGIAVLMMTARLWTCNRAHDYRRNPSLFWFICGIAPVLTLFILSHFWKAHIFQSRYILYAWPCLYLACAGTVNTAGGRLTRTVYALAVIGVMAPLGMLQATMPVRTDYISAGRLIARESGGGRILCQDYNVGRLLAFNMPERSADWMHLPEEARLFAQLDAELAQNRETWLVFGGNESAETRRKLHAHVLVAQRVMERQVFLGMQNLYVYRVFPTAIEADL